jgi:hypothetical protein
MLTKVLGCCASISPLKSICDSAFALSLSLSFFLAFIFYLFIARIYLLFIEKKKKKERKEK